MIIGAGLAGTAAAWSLARRGRSVILVEQFPPDHAHGSSHGSARIVRRAYGDGLYTALTGQAFELWREVEIASGTPLLRMLGGLDFGPRRSVSTVAAHLAAAGVEHEVVSAADASSRWPGMEFEGQVVFHPQAGTLDSGLAVSTFAALASSMGASVRWSTGAASVSSSGVVHLSDGTSLSASHTVVATGAWVQSLVEPVMTLPPLRVTQHQIFHFPRRDPSQDPWPSTIHEASTGALYHLAGGRDGGPGDNRKIGEHDGGSACSVDTRTGVVDPASRDRVVNYVRRWLPGLVDEPTSEATCLYTETPTEDFVLDRVGPVVVCSPCSGHGAKFAPLIGELVASLVCGDGSDVPDRFRLASHLSGRPGAVSL